MHATRYRRSWVLLVLGALILSSVSFFVQSQKDIHGTAGSAEAAPSNGDGHRGPPRHSDGSGGLEGVFDTDSFRLLIDGSKIREDDIKNILIHTERSITVPEALMNDIRSLATRSDTLIEQLRSLEKFYVHVKEDQKEVEQLLKEANLIQVNRVLEDLSDTHKREKALRDSAAAAAAAADSKFKNKMTIPTITKEQLKKAFDKKEMLSESDQDLEDWVGSIIEQEIAEFQSKSLSQRTEDSSDCAPYTKVAEKVQSKIVKFSQDGIGLFDHAHGSTVVYEMSSETYVPPTDPDRLLGNVWWRRFIPEDWEEQLPQGWESWDTTIPSYVHALLRSDGSKTMPHEAVLSKNTSPGMCWPMVGQSGQITLRLPYPIIISSVSIDHASALSVQEDELDSAPKKVTVIGYRPCTEGDAGCAKLGFDTSSVVTLGQFTFDRLVLKTQTFSITSLEVPLVEKEDKNSKAFVDHDDDDVVDQNSCSAIAATCSSPTPSVFGAITFRIEENWGHPDYTCLYRVRVHGDMA